MGGLVVVVVVVVHVEVLGSRQREQSVVETEIARGLLWIMMIIIPGRHVGRRLLLLLMLLLESKLLLQSVQLGIHPRSMLLSRLAFFLFMLLLLLLQKGQSVGGRCFNALLEEATRQFHFNLGRQIRNTLDDRARWVLLLLLVQGQ